MRKSILFVVYLAITLSLLLAACRPTVTPGEATATPGEKPEVPPADVSSERVQIRWFVGLGVGTEPATLRVERAFVEKFNASQDRIELVLEVAPQASDAAVGTLRSMIEAGNLPDIVGPAGWGSRMDAFADQWLDLEDLVASYDLSDFSPGSIDACRWRDGQLVGLPVGVLPPAIFYNRDLFDAAGVAYPPHQYGEPYADGSEWTVEKMEEVAMQLTRDTNGNDATSPDFDPRRTVQYGYHWQWASLDGIALLFGPGSFVDTDGNATIPDHWREAFHWYYEGMWEKHFIPTKQMYGNPFASGEVAMVRVHSWYVGNLADARFKWDLAALPSHRGMITADMYTDMFSILNTTQHPQEAAEVIYALVSSPELLTAWGVLPTRQGLQEGYVQRLDEHGFARVLHLAVYRPTFGARSPRLGGVWGESGLLLNAPGNGAASV